MSAAGIEHGPVYDAVLGRRDLGSELGLGVRGVAGDRDVAGDRGVLYDLCEGRRELSRVPRGGGGSRASGDVRVAFFVGAAHVHQGPAEGEGNVGNEHRGLALLSPVAALIDLDHVGRTHLEQLLHRLQREHHGSCWLLDHEVRVLRGAHLAEELRKGADPVRDLSLAATFDVSVVVTFDVAAGELAPVRARGCGEHNTRRLVGERVDQVLADQRVV